MNVCLRYNGAVINEGLLEDPVIEPQEDRQRLLVTSAWILYQ